MKPTEYNIDITFSQKDAEGFTGYGFHRHQGANVALALISALASMTEERMKLVHKIKIEQVAKAPIACDERKGMD